MDNATATPVDTTQVITESLQDAGLVDDAGNEVTSTDDASTDDAVNASADETTDAPVDTQNTDDQTDPLQPEPDALLKDYAKKRNNRIPYSRVEKIVAKAREEASAAAKQAALAEASQRYAHYESPEFASIVESFQEAVTDPEKFLNRLAQNDNRYAQLLQARREAARVEASSSRTNEVAPDVQYPDGSVGYTPEAFDRMIAARVKAAEDAIEQKFTQRFGPIEQSFRQHQLRAGAVEKVQNLIASAQKWPGFVENQPEITAAVQADRTLSLEDAYRKVVFGKLSASRNEVRKQVLAEINAKSKASTSRPSSGATQVTSSTPQTTEDIIRQALRDQGKL